MTSNDLSFSKEDIIKYRLQKSSKLLEEIKFLLDNGYANTAISRMYYACYHAISALLFHNNIDTRTHKGLRLQFNNHFVKTGKISIDKARIFARIYERRQESDYDDFMEFTLSQAKEYNSVIIDLIKIIHSLIKEL